MVGALPTHSLLETTPNPGIFFKFRPSSGWVTENIIDLRHQLMFVSDDPIEVFILPNHSESSEISL